MNKKRLVIFIIILIVGFTVVYLNIKERKDKGNSSCNPNSASMTCENKIETFTNNNYKRTSKNVTIEVIENSINSKEATILITDKNEHSYGWGEEFRIQKKENGEWQNLKGITDTFAFSEIAYALNKNNQLIQKIEWTDYYGELPKGTYRIVKQVYENKYIDIFSNEFEI